ncbi:hypothetical protein NLX74_25510 [Paenibacillus sp. MZ03-122A]|nr:hypothetical protein [Paenibacillus sp. MZ03-122A]
MFKSYKSKEGHQERRRKPSRAQSGFSEPFTSDSTCRPLFAPPDSSGGLPPGEGNSGF